MSTPSIRPDIADTSALDLPVVFDFDGALLLARRLAALADDWAEAFGVYRTRADEALAAWSGPARNRVDERVAAERRDSDATVAALRAEADRWAMAWADAADEVRRQRWLLAVTAGPGGPPATPPPPVAIPRGPGYEPTVDVLAGSGS